MPKIIHKELSHNVRGVLLHVYNALGPMLPERYYQDAIAIGLEACGVRCETEKVFEVYYRRVRVGLYRVDVWIENGKIVLELKVAPEILPLHRAQAISYFKVTGADLAIVATFGAGSLLDERFPNFVRGRVVSYEWRDCPASADLLYPAFTNRIFEALHQVYRRATLEELKYRELGFEYLKEMPVYYEGYCLGIQPSRLICVENKVLLATIAVKHAGKEMQERLRARLRHLGLQPGLLANFNSTMRQIIPVRLPMRVDFASDSL
jgi:GxxExxY protein